MIAQSDKNLTIVMYLIKTERSVIRFFVVFGSK